MVDKLHLNLSDDLEKKPTRDGFGKALAELGEENENIWVLTADVSGSTRTNWFADKFPKRFVQVGVAEQNMTGVAAGIAACGKTVFISAFGAFCPGRNWDQIRVSLCYNNSNVKIHASHTGLAVGPDGASHQALEDLASVRSLPNITILTPADMLETLKATKAAAALDTPCYIRTSREKTPVFTTKKTPFKIGKANVCHEGSDVAIFTYGAQVYESLKAAELLEKKGISAAVVNCHTIKPFDIDVVKKYAKKVKLIITVEDHQINGGLGSVVAEALSEVNSSCRLKRHGMYDCFGESGSAKELFEKYKLDAKGIASIVKKEFGKK